MSKPICALLFLYFFFLSIHDRWLLYIENQFIVIFFPLYSGLMDLYYSKVFYSYSNSIKFFWIELNWMNRIIFREALTFTVLYDRIEWLKISGDCAIFPGFLMTDHKICTNRRTPCNRPFVRNITLITLWITAEHIQYKTVVITKQYQC